MGAATLALNENLSQNVHDDSDEEHSNNSIDELWVLVLLAAKSTKIFFCYFLFRGSPFGSLHFANLNSRKIKYSLFIPINLGSIIDKERGDFLLLADGFRVPLV